MIQDYNIKMYILIVSNYVFDRGYFKFRHHAGRIYFVPLLCSFTRRWMLSMANRLEEQILVLHWVNFLTMAVIPYHKVTFSTSDFRTKKQMANLSKCLFI